MRMRKGPLRRRRRKSEIEEQRPVPVPVAGRSVKRSLRGRAGGPIQKLAARVLKRTLKKPSLSATGKTASVDTEVYGRSLRLHGRTRARFNGGSFRTENVVVTQGQGCRGCRPRQCVHVTGTLVVDYSVTTQVTLPSVSQYRNLTSCQRKRVQDAITNVLTPHEQRHVNAFRQYNGTTRRRFGFTLCRNRFNQQIRRMVNIEAQARQRSAQAASDALDPFFHEVNLDCKDK